MSTVCGLKLSTQISKLTKAVDVSLIPINYIIKEVASNKSSL